MEKAIKKAIQIGIEAGIYGNPEKVRKFNWFIKDDLIHFDNGLDGVMISLHKQFLRTEFWQAIGKSEGWIENNDIHQWKAVTHDFIDHINNRGDIESFFNSLLR